MGRLRGPCSYSCPCIYARILALAALLLLVLLLPGMLSCLRACELLLLAQMTPRKFCISCHPLFLYTVRQCSVFATLAPRLLLRGAYLASSGPAVGGRRPWRIPCTAGTLAPPSASTPLSSLPPPLLQPLRLARPPIAVSSFSCTLRHILLQVPPAGRPSGSAPILWFFFH